MRITTGEFNGYEYELSFSDKDKDGKWMKQPEFCVAIGINSRTEADELKDQLKLLVKRFES